MNRKSYIRPRVSSGFGLVEVLVGMVLGLITMLVIMQVYAVFEGQKRTTSSGSDTQTNGALSLFTIERDAKVAGYGFGVVSALGCKVNTSFNNAHSSFNLAPLTITQGAGNAPDTIQMLASTASSFSVPARITVDHPATATNFFIDSTVGMNVNDLMIAFEPGKDCTLIQITGIPNGNIQIHHQNTSPWNPPGGQNIFPPGGYLASNKAGLLNIGSLLDRTYSVSAATTGGLVLTELNTATNTSLTQTIAPDIINLQAEYGKDTDNDGVVDTWDTTTPTTAAGWLQLYAVRVAIVARSGLYEKDLVTNGPGTLNWAGGTLHIDINPDGSANADWKHYRYSLFQTTVPLRNMIWRQ